MRHANSGSLPVLGPDRRQALELVEAPLWLTEPETMALVWANSAGLRFWGTQSIAAINEDARRRGVTPAARFRFDQAWEACLHGEVLRFEHTLHVAAGPRRVRLVCRAAQQPLGGARLMLTEVANPTDSPNNAAQRALDILGSVPAAAVLFDERGHPIWENQCALRQFSARGNRRPTLRERFFEQEAAEKVWSRLLARGHFLGEVQIQTIRGPRWSILDAQTSRDGVDGRPAIIVGLVDIHRWKCAELDLREAKNEAERASLSKSEFLANMSHEIRTPMNGVLGALELLDRFDLEEPQRRLVGTVRRSARTLLEILNDILDLSRIEAGKLRLEKLDFDLPEALQDVISLHEQNAHRKGLELHTFEPERLPKRVVGDPVRLSQVVGNLLSNAIKFTAKGKVAVHAKVIEETGEEVLLELGVTDSGCGVDGEEQARIFRAFEQGDGSVTRRYGGTGLGLTISSKISRLMGGELNLESTPGEGSRFWFTARLGLPGPGGETFDIVPVGNLDGLQVGLYGPGSSDLHRVQTCLMSFGVQGHQLPSLLQPHDLMEREIQVLFVDMELVEALPELPPDIITVAVTRSPRRRPNWASALLSATELAERPLYHCLSRLLGARSIVLPRTTPPEPLRGTRVLLVEDNPINQQVAVGMLEAFECQVDCTNNGQEAIEALDKRPYDLVLMDCQMPVMDGYTATRAIRKREARLSHRTPIIALTANAMSGDRERCLAVGMDDFLAKPFSLDALREKVLAWRHDRARA